MNLRFASGARNQYHQALAFIRRDDLGAARRFHERVQSSLERLRVFPASGRVVPEFPRSPYREVVVAPYRFFYRAEGATIWIVAVWHGAQLPSEPG